MLTSHLIYIYIYIYIYLLSYPSLKKFQRSPLGMLFLSPGNGQKQLNAMMVGPFSIVDIYAFIQSVLIFCPPPPPLQISSLKC